MSLLLWCVCVDVCVVLWLFCLVRRDVLRACVDVSGLLGLCCCVVASGGCCGMCWFVVFWFRCVFVCVWCWCVSWCFDLLCVDLMCIVVLRLCDVCFGLMSFICSVLIMV